MGIRWNHTKINYLSKAFILSFQCIFFIQGINLFQILLVFKDRRLETSRRGKQQLKVYLNLYEVRTHVLVLFYVLTVYYYIEKYFQIFCSTRASCKIVAVFPIKTFPISTFMFTFDIICHYIYSYSIEKFMAFWNHV